MNDPVEIMARAIQDENTSDYEISDPEFLANELLACKEDAKAAIAALEAAGYRLLSAETTHPMDNAVADYFSGSLSDWRRCWSDLFAAAPLFGKGSEKSAPTPPHGKDER